MRNFPITFSPFLSAGVEMTVASRLAATFASLATLSDASRANHLDVIIHQGARAAWIAKLDEVRKLGMNLEDVAREFRRGGDIAAWPGDVLERHQLHQNDAIVRSLGHCQMEVPGQPGKLVKIPDRRFGLAN